MVELYISPTEMQYGLKRDRVDQQNLNDLAFGANTVIVELLLKEYVQDVADCEKRNGNIVYTRVGDNGFVNYLMLYNAFIASRDIALVIQGTPVWFDIIRLANIFRSTVHIWAIFRALTATVFVNGQMVRSAVGKNAHNVAAQRLTMFSEAIVGGLATPSVGCMQRIYWGNMVTLSDATLLSYHRKYLRIPLVRVAELNAYLKFAWEGRNADGSQILASSTSIQNAMNGDTLALVGGNFGAAREPVWVPR